MKTTKAICLVFVGCCLNVVFMEMLVKEDPGIGNFVTFSQFLVVAIQGFIFTSKCGTVQPKIGLKDYSLLVCLYFLVNICNNYAFDFNIPMPLHMIFRAGSLLTNMVMGVVVLKKKYSLSKYSSVAMIMSGIVICTVMSGKQVQEKTAVLTSHYEDFFWWTIGILLLIFALLVSAWLGIYQEVLYKKHGKHPEEALFYTHLLPLPLFLLLYTNISDHFLLAVQSTPINLVVVRVPSSLLYLAGNVASQYLCISSVYVLTTEFSSLTVTLVMNLRKFVSLLVTVVVFQNAFTVYHWLGTFFVFFGTVIFTDLHGQVYRRLMLSEEKKSQ